jgi:hypothetical protein
MIGGLASFLIDCQSVVPSMVDNSSVGYILPILISLLLDISLRIILLISLATNSCSPSLSIANNHILLNIQPKIHRIEDDKNNITAMISSILETF